MVDMSQFKRKVTEFEGRKAHMYVDGRRNVTVGVGRMLPTSSDAARLPFIRRDDKRRAARAEIEQEFDAIRTMSGDASKIETATRLRLEERDIDRMLDDDIERTLDALKRWETGKNFDELPEEVQLALLDMAFNLGPGKLKIQYRKLKEAIATEDWSRAAEECGRRGPQPARNAWTRDMFQRAARR
jgi:GH24 family phage-related lysozyme (muramidase)